MQKLKLLLALITCITVEEGKSQQSANNLLLKGKLFNYQKILAIEANSELGPLSDFSSEYQISPNETGAFELGFSIPETNYYKIGRNIVLLGPNKKIIANIDYNWPDSSSFAGDSSAENNYLRSTPFPAAGSFLAGGDNVKATIPETIREIERLANERRKLLGNSNPYQNILKSTKRTGLLQTASTVSNTLVFTLIRSTRSAEIQQ